jgi:hypothetical protein
MFSFDLTNWRDRLRNEAPLTEADCSMIRPPSLAADRQRSPYSLILR